jgi:hypothetical protein
VSSSASHQQFFVGGQFYPSQSACDNWQQRYSGRRVLVRLLKLKIRFVRLKEIVEFFRRIE